MIHFQTIVDKVRQNHPGADEELLRRAYLFSARQHRGQIRKSGEPYLVHPLEVANILAELKLDPVCVEAPIARRTGMSRGRGELEDWAFRFLEREGYQKLKEWGESRRARLDKFLEDVKARIRQLADESGIHIEMIDGRLKRLFSIHQKLKRQHITIDQVYDLVAIRIITESVKDCYAALGVIHAAWKPIPTRFKDWIAIPRENFYQSLHTSVVGEGGQPFEVQIRTQEMQSIAEEGIDAHWKYKEGRRGTHTEEDEAFVWLKRLVEWQQEVKDSREFLDSLKLDLYPKEVYCFTPKGKVIELPRGATPIDFAFAIHTQVGLACTGAKVNGRIVPLRYQLRNGDVVEIMTSPSAHPSRDWMNFAKTSRARSKIRHYLAESERVTAIEIGKKLFEKEADRFRLNPKKLLLNGDLDRIA